MTSLKETLVRYLSSHNEWKSKGYITDTLSWKYAEKGIEKTYLSETVGRKLRELESEKRIAVKDDGVSVQYKFLPIDKRPFYVPVSKRKDKSKLWIPSNVHLNKINPSTSFISS